MLLVFGGNSNIYRRQASSVEQMAVNILNNYAGHAFLLQNKTINLY
jgi:hypothetical protein